MPAKKTVNDAFANIAYMAVTESAANTLTFAKLEMASNLMTEKAALIIHAAEIYLNYPSLMDTNGDTLGMAITLSDRLTTIGDLSQPEILISFGFGRYDYGAAASGLLVVRPQKMDFTSMPGGGLLVPADRLYIGVKGSGCSAAGSAIARIYYTVKLLETADYWELIEARRIMTT